MDVPIIVTLMKCWYLTWCIINKYAKAWMKESIDQSVSDSFIDSPYPCKRLAVFKSVSKYAIEVNGSKIQCSRRKQSRCGLGLNQNLLRLMSRFWSRARWTALGMSSAPTSRSRPLRLFRLLVHEIIVCAARRLVPGSWPWSRGSRSGTSSVFAIRAAGVFGRGSAFPWWRRPATQRSEEENCKDDSQYCRSDLEKHHEACWCSEQATPTAGMRFWWARRLNCIVTIVVRFVDARVVFLHGYVIIKPTCSLSPVIDILRSSSQINIWR